MKHALQFALLASVLSAQQFDVASIKKSAPMEGFAVYTLPSTGGPGTADPTHILWPGAALKFILTTAFDVKSYQLTIPGWMDSERYDFAVAVPAGATRAQVRLMWQDLLAKRFGVVVHHETRDFQVDQLVVGRGGHKLLETADATPAVEGPPKFENGKLVSIALITMFRDTPTGTVAQLTGKGQGMAALAVLLSNQLGHPVVDKTGLSAKYDFEVNFAPPGPGADLGLDLGSAVQQQLGLRLVSGKAPLDFIVVDKAEKVPTDN